MEDPYTLCCVPGCRAFSCDTHHEPGKGAGLHKEDYDNPRYHRKMCRRHHEQRERIGYWRFLIKHPNYDGIRITTYRHIKRMERAQRRETMRKGIVLLLAVMLVACSVAVAETTSDGNYYTNPTADYWLNKCIPHNHQYVDTDTIYEPKTQLGIGVDVTVYEFEGSPYSWGLESIEVQNKYDFNNTEYSMYGVVQVNAWRPLKKLFGIK